MYKKQYIQEEGIKYSEGADPGGSKINTGNGAMQRDMH